MSANSPRKNALAAEKYLESRFRYLRGYLEKIWKSSASDFYRNKYEAAGLKLSGINKPDDWLKIPYLTKNDLQKYEPYDRSYVGPKEITAVRSTSGTTGEPLIMLRSERPDTGKYLKFFEFNAVFSLFGYCRYYTLIESLGKIGKIFVAGDMHDMPRSASMAKGIGADALIGTGSILILFQPHLKKLMPPEKIRLIILIGEYATRIQRGNLKKLFPKAKIISFYNSVESGLREITFPCFETAKYHGRYHIAEDAGFFEISPEGEIILTTFFGSTPLIRYKTGDLGAFVGEPCACGRKEPLINICGRINFDFIRMRGLEIRAEEVERGIGRVFGIKNPEFKLHIFERQDSPPEVKLELALKRKPEKFSGIPDRMLAAMVGKKIAASANLSLADAVENGLLKSFSLDFVSEFPMEQKKKRIIFHEF